ncbi:LarC family nickel insertion protein [Neobacillus sp. C211]|uniref:LarC family nickel insertion protein n=1 Tax=unclassified Neobacillus TaxID=2675272 RepID=UPI00397D3934
MKTLYFDCFSGISGDMVIGALIDAGADPNRLVEELKKLHIDDEYKLTWTKLVKNGITSTKFDVVLLNNAHDHTHDHDHDHDHDHHHVHNHNHEHDHNHDHHSHSHEHEHHHHEHRAYKDIVGLIESAGFVEPVKEMSLKIFKRIGEAEGHIHGIPLEKVHFHEVGAVDSIIDIIGAAILIHQLEIDVIKSSPIPVGTGRIHIDHGIYPVPAPATLEILKGVPIEQSDIRFELTTPTGAAIVAVLAEEFCPIPSMKVTSIGYGAGTKTFINHPNVLRVIIGE